MSGTEWFILIVIVILLPLAIAVAVTLWTLEMARQRNKRNRSDRVVGVKRRATRPPPTDAVRVDHEGQVQDEARPSEAERR